MAKRPSKRQTAKPQPKHPDRRGTPKGKGTVKANGGSIGNPSYDPTPENCIRVEAMVAAGAEQWFIAEELGISLMTLKRHHRPQLDHGKQRVDWKVGGSIAQKALDGDPDFMKFYAARRAGWKTTTAVEASGPGGGAIVVTINGVDAKL